MIGRPFSKGCLPTSLIVKSIKNQFHGRRIASPPTVKKEKKKVVQYTHTVSM
jgi:hypothetical protein